MLNRKRNKETRIERTFSIMLVEEILRAELRRWSGNNVQFLHCDITATPVSEVIQIGANISDSERDLVVRPSMRGSCFERTVKIAAIIGTLEPAFPNNPVEEKRKKLRRVEATCRLFTTESGARYWKPHFLTWVVKNEYGQSVESDGCRYVNGSVHGCYQKKNAENPCEDMVASQIPANYPMFHGELHGQKRDLRELQFIS